SCLRGSTPSRRLTSTVGSNLVTWVALARSTASAGLYRFCGLILASASWYALLRFMNAPCECMEVVVVGARARPCHCVSPGGGHTPSPGTPGPAAFRRAVFPRLRSLVSSVAPAQSRRRGGLLKPPLALDLDAHRPGGAGDDLLGGLDRVGVQVRHLGL